MGYFSGSQNLKISSLDSEGNEKERDTEGSFNKRALSFANPPFSLKQSLTVTIEDRLERLLR